MLINLQTQPVNWSWKMIVVGIVFEGQTNLLPMYIGIKL